MDDERAGTRQALQARLSRVEGQVRGIQRMVEQQRPCEEILAQLRSAINALCRAQDRVLHEHLRRCVTESFGAAGHGERGRKVDEVLALLGKYREP
jgi:DNA-binding FrmR family transcriptional regulator